MGALKRVNGGVGQDQWGHWSGSMGLLKRVNGGIEKGQVRQGPGCGSDRRLSYRAVSTTLQGCKLYLAGL